jgi:hypothetical protein
MALSACWLFAGWDGPGRHTCAASHTHTHTHTHTFRATPHAWHTTAEELESLTTPPPRDQLERAKAMAVSLIQSALESKAASAEDLGRQYLTYGHRCACVGAVWLLHTHVPAASPTCLDARRSVGLSVGPHVAHPRTLTDKHTQRPAYIHTHARARTHRTTTQGEHA